MADIRDARPEDVEQVYELLDARSRANFGVSEVSRDEVEADFRRPGLERWVAVSRSRVVGYAHLTSAHELVHAATDRGAGLDLLRRVERRARERGFRAVETTVAAEDAPLDELVRGSGFVHERDVLRMWRRLNGREPEPDLPRGIRVRSYRDDDAPRVQALLDEAYGAWDGTYVPRPHDEWLAFMTDHGEFDPALWFLAVRDGALVACALCWREHQRRGWVKDLVVRERERGSGLAKALLRHGFRAYSARGVEQVGLKVDSTNPTGAPQLYERLGFAVDRRYGIWRKAL